MRRDTLGMGGRGGEGSNISVSRDISGRTKNQDFYFSKCTTLLDEHGV